MATPPPVIPNTFTVEPFCPTSTTWSRWLLRLERAFRIFSIKDEARVPYLLHYVGPTSFDIVCDQLAENPFTVDYVTLTEVLGNFYEPAPLEIAENFKFHQRKQKSKESVQEFLAALQKLSLHCKFGTYLKTALRNQFVFGLMNKKIQARLLEIPDLTLERATQKATTMEMSEKGSQQLQGGTTDVNLVHTAKRTTQRGGNTDKSHKFKNFKNTNTRNFSHTSNSTSAQKIDNVTCYRCGKNHLATKCTLDKKTKCNAYGKTGHLQRVCFQRNKQQNNQLTEVLQMEHTQFRDKWETTLLVSDKRVKFEIDSGAVVSVMAEDLARKLFPNSSIYPTNLTLVSYCRNKIRPLGYIVVDVRCCKNIQELNLYLTKERRNTLLGREWIFQLRKDRTIGQIVNNIESINLVETTLKTKLNLLLQKYQSVMSPATSKIRGVQAKLTLKDDAKAIFCKARSVPFRLHPMIEKELQRLESEGILVKVDTSEWATPIVPVIKKNGQIHICGDFSVTLNAQLIVDDHPLPTADELFASMAGGVIFSKIDLLQAYLQMEVRPEDGHLLTLNTHKGLYRCIRLMYRICASNLAKNDGKYFR